MPRCECCLILNPGGEPIDPDKMVPIGHGLYVCGWCHENQHHTTSPVVDKLSVLNMLMPDAN